MITDQRVITELKAKFSAIQVAAYCYKRWMGDVSFEEDVADYLANGIVIARPDLFGMAKLIALPKTGDRAWFVRMAVGPLDRLLECLPCYLPKICFCRRNDGRVREYSLKRLATIAARERKGGLKKWEVEHQVCHNKT